MVVRPRHRIAPRPDACDDLAPGVDRLAGGPPSLALVGGTPAIAYADTVNLTLKYARAASNTA